MNYRFISLLSQALYSNSTFKIDSDTTQRGDSTFLQKSPVPVGGSPRDDHNDAGPEGCWARCRDERNRSPAVRVPNGLSVQRSFAYPTFPTLSPTRSTPVRHNHQLHPSHAASHPPLQGSHSACSRAVCRIVQCLRAGPGKRV